MTRDIKGFRDGHDPASEDEVYAALWATAPFPRLPEDAPDELKNFIVDVEDPKRLYTIHCAARRHQFQLLVERYIFQIRYGCKVKTCSTTTCFSCRKRLAAGAPVRRYNATSARTLAIYMASQDNPDQGLCHHPSADRPPPKTPNPHKSWKDASSETVDSTSNGSSRRRNESDERGTNNKSREISSISARARPTTSTAGTDGRPKGQKRSLEIAPYEEPTPIDHRSFVQNVFGTVAFKMVEWLTPSNMEALSRPDEEEREVVSQPGGPTNSTANPVTEVVAIPLPVPKPQIKPDTHPSNNNQGPEATTFSPPKSCNNEHKSRPIADSKTVANSLTRRNSKLNGGRRHEAHEPQNPKGILNLSSRTNDTPEMIDLQQFQPPRTKRTLSTSRKTLITNPMLHMPERELSSVLKTATIKLLPEVKKDSIKDEAIDHVRRDSHLATKGAVKKLTRETPIPDSLPVEDKILPQSLSLLPIDLLNFLCDTLQSHGTLEKHDLHPAEISQPLMRWLNNSSSYKQGRGSASRNGSNYSNSAKEQWKSFIEQGFFDVLSKSDSLIQSFSYCDQRLYDTQTMWYLMLRLTRVAPSLVFDSLWIAAADLFNPPESLESIQDWSKEDPSSSSRKALPNNEAARLINICLHALVAAAPLVVDARQLANMSRIRSFGLAMLGRETSSLEPVKLCLQYEDAFTNDLALRLARRLFASISTRRRFTELMELQNDVRADGKREPDVLEGVLATLKFLDIGTIPALDFHNQERDLHEKRVPTLLLDWARTVMLQDWDGSAEVPADGSFGGALAMMAAIYKHRKSLLLGDIHFRTEYFAERLDPVSMPLGWLSFETNRRTLHLLDYPYLFNPSTLVTYFRAINYSRMNEAYESGKATTGLVHSMASENQLMTDQSTRYRLFERLRVATSKFLVLEISRRSVLVDTFNAIWRREERELMRPLKVRLGEGGGEEGLDSGGVQQEFFRLAIAEALNPDYGTFTIDSRTKMTWFQPGSPEPLWKSQLIGTIVSLAIYNGLTLPVTFPKALYRKLLDHEVTELHHIEDGWPDLTNGLTSLLEWDEKDGLVEEIFARTYEFSTEQFGQAVSREIGEYTPWPQFSDPQASSANPEDAPMVTNENRNNFVSDYIRWLTDVSINPQFEAFKTGFFTCVDRRSLSLFDPDTLQSVVEGIQEIDISEMRRATRYIGWEASHRTVRDFWSIVKRYDLPTKKKLLEFVTASDRVPVGGMRNLQFTLQRNGIDDVHLPTTYTCYGILLLPEYSSKDVLREKLKMALENSKGFGFA
ncbi:hypothetical protein HYALB_00007577 [Hymenoscyphus albidus]|uniref:HECT domain-containing protein n=1 Tax=Hymenoscyphus albidus TaxID=595503 RepID=A0A9N9LD37_9HELO|nr:hypothetical protein HYALB_00007577 [Hymenoscyphus albidus]